MIISYVIDAVLVLVLTISIGNMSDNWYIATGIGVALLAITFGLISMRMAEIPRDNTQEFDTRF